jgi:hypothetical protein
MHPVGHLDAGAAKVPSRDPGVVIRNFAAINPLETSKTTSGVFSLT